MKNLILTDIMKTGHHWWYGDFFRYNTITSQQITIVDDYYRLNEHSLVSYDRKIAIICAMNDFLLNNQEYKTDLMKKIEKLKKEGFKFILGTPWESRENTKRNQHYDLLKNHCYHAWYGDHDWFWYYMYAKNKDRNFIFDHSNKIYDFLYLNKIPRAHRKKLFEKIVSHGLLNNSLYSFTNLKSPHRLPAEYELPWLSGLQYPSQHGKEDQDIFEKPYNASVVNIVSETNDNNDEIFITEKLWKPIIAGQPFVVHGNHKILSKLKDMGFKTFDSVWDESYDDETDPDKRIVKIVQVLIAIKNNKFFDLYQQTKDIRYHNQNLFWNKLKLSEIINTRLSKFLLLYDKQ